MVPEFPYATERSKNQYNIMGGQSSRVHQECLTQKFNFWAALSMECCPFIPLLLNKLAFT